MYITAYPESSYIIYLINHLIFPRSSIVLILSGPEWLWKCPLFLPYYCIAIYLLIFNHTLVCDPSLKGWTLDFILNIFHGSSFGTVLLAKPGVTQNTSNAKNRSILYTDTCNKFKSSIIPSKSRYKHYAWK